MDIFDVLTLIGGLCLFLFGMNLMGGALERSAGSKLEIMIGKLTSGRLAGLLTGLGVTAVIQSSSATTVMVVGFATLMFGMETMTGAVSGLRDVPAFGELFIMSKNPILGVIGGADGIDLDLIFDKLKSKSLS